MRDQPKGEETREESGDARLGAKGQFIMFDEPVSKVRHHRCCDAGCFSAAGDDADDGGGGADGDAVSDVCSATTNPLHR